ncbi:Putative uncharacterized protein [Taphrina deformans PYCC 5710]|uniref:Phosphoglycerate mutase family protein n=1 Tax=Taphrina deformans (strain PYCC 5710 / ATCC 11124 / CBS 356.35 / IMI 108563 / JCM 9778 / NBRC 8474) TaxID=1097556 RepID=R4XAQ9_TAPDE|nr:Putative uncharacterized protein [Taphrina deformans PYCC 5710]|eukprot:CCG82898.1 Putative uncharacterized protein [Taphrina deformans PYCC 5710]
MKIYLIRHAETDSNVKKIIQGTINTPLNSNGHSQAECLGRRMRAIKPSHIFCSDLQRCQETLKHVTDMQEPSDLPTVQYTEQLRERYMAELQGVSKEVVEQLCREQNKTKFDFGESTQELTDRVEDFWRGHVERLYSSAEVKTTGLANGESRSSSGQASVMFVCSHGGTLLQLTKSLNVTFGFKLPPGSKITRASPNTAVTILETETMEIETYADVSHLEALGAAEKEKDEKMEVVDV